MLDAVGEALLWPDDCVPGALPVACGVPCHVPYAMMARPAMITTSPPARILTRNRFPIRGASLRCRMRGEASSLSWSVTVSSRSAAARSCAMTRSGSTGSRRMTCSSASTTVGVAHDCPEEALSNPNCSSSSSMLRSAAIRRRHCRSPAFPDVSRLHPGVPSPSPSSSMRSMMTARPSGVMMMFAGVRSPCTIPAACNALTPAAMPWTI